MKHKLLLLFASILCASNLFAYVTIDGLNYDLDEGTLTASVAKNSGASGGITIPASVSYSEATYSVTSIGDGAFHWCSGLTSVEIPNSVLSIGNDAFDYCRDLTSVTIPESVTSIGNSAFMNCSNLTSVTIPENVTSIGDYTFYGCSSLTSIEIPNGITSIGKAAFEFCKGLTTLFIPSTVTSIGAEAFYGCNNLKSIDVDVTNPDYSSIEGILFNKDLTTLILFPTGNTRTEYVIPNSVTYIGDNAFSGCSSLTSIVIPNSVTSIGDGAFHWCSGLTSVEIPNSVLSIGNATFDYCSSLQTIVIPDNVRSIGNEAFEYCSSLTSVTIPNEVTQIGSRTFFECSNLKSAIIGNNVTNIGSYAFYKCTNLTTIDIPNSVTSIGDEAFYGCSSLPVIDNLRYADSYLIEAVNKTLSNYDIRRGTRFIGPRAFSGCTNLTSVIIPQTITNIGADAFYGCTGLKQIIAMPIEPPTIQGWEYLYISRNYEGEGDFREYSYNDITFPVYVYEESVDAYKEAVGWKLCTNIVALTQTLTYTYYSSGMTAVVISPAEGLYIGDIDIPSTTEHEGYVYTVTGIGYGAFEGCTNLISVTMPNTIKYISGRAFEGCSSLTSITIPSSVTDINYRAFYGCNSLSNVEISDIAAWCGINFGSPTLRSYANPLEYAQHLYLNGVEVKDLIIPDGVTSIGERAFVKCSSLTSVTIPNSVTSIGNVAFGYCDNLATITLPNSIATIENSTFSHCSSLSTITIPESVTSIDSWAFEYCSNLVSINMPNNISSIGEHAFYYCTSLNSINLPNNLTTIGFAVFANCSSLSSVSIPNSVSSISSSAFAGCSSLTSIYAYSTTPPSFERWDAFQGIPKNAIVYVPFGATSLYKGSDDWKSMNIQGPTISHSVTTLPTSCSASFDVPNTVIASCGVEDGETSAGNTIEFVGLEPESEYKDVPFVLTANTGLSETTSVSFTTTALSLTTQPSKAVNSTTAILLAETNMSDAETGAGFEWKRNDAPADMAGTKVYCPVANGTMAGRLKNLNDQVYYKYRAFYQSAAGNMYYGDWQYIFTGDNAVEFDPVLYTYAATAIKETEATLKGYALAGSDDFTEQGFEYWAESRVSTAAPRRVRSSVIGEHQCVQASGISMKVTLTGLDEGTTYKYRTYAIVGGQTVYGSEMSFTTKGEYVEPTYTITFLNYDGTELLVLTEVMEGTMPEYTGETPTRAEDEEYTYTFSGWQAQGGEVFNFAQTLPAAIEDATYTATYEATKKVTGLEDICTSLPVQAQKLLIDGTLYIILPDGTRYNAIGAKIN